MSGASSGQRTEIFAAFNRKGRKWRRQNSLTQRVFIARMSSKAPKAHADARHPIISGKSGVSGQIKSLADLHRQASSSFGHVYGTAPVGMMIAGTQNTDLKILAIAVCAENLNTGVMVMKSAQDGA